MYETVYTTACTMMISNDGGCFSSSAMQTRYRILLGVCCLKCFKILFNTQSSRHYIHARQFCAAVNTMTWQVSNCTPECAMQLQDCKLDARRNQFNSHSRCAFNSCQHARTMLLVCAKRFAADFCNLQAPQRLQKCHEHATLKPNCNWGLGHTYSFTSRSSCLVRCSFFVHAREADS